MCYWWGYSACMLLQWWNDIVNWAASYQGHAMVTGVILPFIAILTGALVAGAMVRGAIKRLLAQQERNAKVSAVAGLISAGRRASVWSTLSAQEKEHAEYVASEAEVRLRLLPVAGAGLAADWSAHYIASMKKNSSNFSFQSEQDLVDLQDGLLAWQSKPKRAKKMFASDLAAWKYDTGLVEDDLIVKQREWAAQQAA